MKSIITKIILLFVLCALLVGCTANQPQATLPKEVVEQAEKETSKYRILEVGFSDSASGAAHHIEFGYWAEENLPVPDEKIVTVELGDITMTGEYDKSKRMSLTNYTSYVYWDHEKGFFELDENGKLTAIYKMQSGTDVDEGANKKASQEECQKIALQHLQKYADAGQYQIKSSYSETFSLYTFEFTKYIGEYRTADMATVYIGDTGEFQGMKLWMLNRIPADIEINFDCEAVEKEVFSKLDEIYSDVKQYYDEITYETYDVCVTILETGEVALYYTVDVDMFFPVAGMQACTGELVSFVVMNG